MPKQRERIWTNNFRLLVCFISITFAQSLTNLSMAIFNRTRYIFGQQKLIRTIFRNHIDSIS
jgi:hypothetical protein